MFFGKAWNKDCKGAREAYSPLSQEQLTELFDLFYSLSRHKPQTIFYVMPAIQPAPSLHFQWMSIRLIRQVLELMQIGNHTKTTPR